MRKTRGEKGITLIALIITIIVLLILALVTIRAVQGDGIISKAQQARDEYAEAQAKEKVALQLEEWKILKHTQGDANLASFLAEKFGTENVISNEDGTYTVKVDGYGVIVDAEGNITGITSDSNAGNENNLGDEENNNTDEDETNGDNSGSEQEEIKTATGPWTYNGDGTYTSSNGVILEIGDYVDYNEGSYTHTPDTEKGAGTSKTGGDYSTGYTLGTKELTTENLSWRVLGVNDNGQLELISANQTTQSLYLANDEGYLNAEDNLNNFCNDLYGKGSYASSARSLNVEDINKLTNYDPTTYSGYGVEWMYRYPTEEEMGSTTRYMQSSKDNGITWNNITNSNYQTFRLPEETTAISSTNPGRKELTYTFYYYNIADNLTTEDGFTSEKATAISNIITQGTSVSNVNHWLASRCVNCNSGSANFYVRIVNGGNVKCTNLFNSGEGFMCAYYRVRPVVTLSSDVTITTNAKVNSSTNMWTLS